MAPFAMCGVRNRKWVAVLHFSLEICAFEDFEELCGSTAAQLVVAVLAMARGILLAVMVGPYGFLSGVFITGLVVAMITFSLSRKPYDWA